ncbi:MAG: hypothetical protein ABJB76_04825 [Candidatus Nitrosocosmicus sp.]
MSNNYNDNNQTKNKRKPITPSIGEAVKEAIETGREVIIEGPTDSGVVVVEAAATGDTTGIKNSTFNINGLDKVNKEIDKGIVMSLDETNDSKIEINVKDPSTETSLIEDKIILNQESAEATIAAVTTIPAEEGVEVQTEVEVLVEDKDKDIESELKVLVHSPTLSTEVPLMSSSSPQQPLTPLLQQERTSTSFNKQENQQSSNKVLLDETKNNINKSTNKSTQTISRYTQTIDKVQEQISQATKDITDGYMELQIQTINSFQNTFASILENTNTIFWNNSTYCRKLPEIYSRIALVYTENTIAVSKMINDIAFANANSVKNLFNMAKENPK